MTCRLDLVLSRDFRLVTGPTLYMHAHGVWPDRGGAEVGVLGFHEFLDKFWGLTRGVPSQTVLYGSHMDIRGRGGCVGGSGGKSPFKAKPYVVSANSKNPLCSVSSPYSTKSDCCSPSNAYGALIGVQRGKGQKNSGGRRRPKFCLFNGKNEKCKKKTFLIEDDFWSF